MSVPWWRRFTRWALRRQPRLVRIHMHGDDPSITGFLLGRWGGHYVLAIAKLHETVETAVPLDGEISVPVANVYIVQRLVGVDS